MPEHNNLINSSQNIFRPDRVFMVLAGLNSIILCFLTPPFEVHDEFQHFFRAYQLSEFHIWGILDQNRGGDVLPRSLVAFVQNAWGTLEIWKVPPLTGRPIDVTWSHLSQPLASGDREFIDFSGSVHYFPMPYIPQVFGLLIGRMFEVSPFGLLILGRLANALTSVVLIGWALRRMPLGQEVACIFGLFPMAQYEYASLAPDGLIIASAYVSGALILRASQRGIYRIWEVPVVAIAALGFCGIKPVYAPLLLIGNPLRRTGDVRTWRNYRVTVVFLLQILIMLATIYLASVWISSNKDLMVSALTERTHAAFNLKTLREAPWGHAIRLAQDAWYHGAFYWRDMVGIFGATTLPLPRFCSGAALLAVALAALSSSRRDIALSTSAIGWTAMCVFMTAVAIETVLWIVATPTGTPLISGVQGRYFFPLAPAAAAVLASLPVIPVISGWRYSFYPVAVIIAGLNTVIMDATLIMGFKIL